MKSILIAILLLTAYDSYCQTWQWGKRGGGLDNDEIVDMTTDNGGNVYILANVLTYPTLTGDTAQGPGISYGASDMLVASYSCNGTFRWKKTIGGQSLDYPNRIGTDTLGHVYITGMVEPVISFPQIKVHFDTDTILPYPTKKSMFIIQYDTSGQFKWLRQPTPDSITNPYTSFDAGQPVDMIVSNDGKAEILCYLKAGLLAGGGSFVADSARPYVLTYNAAGNIVSLKKPQMSFVRDIFDNIRLAKTKSSKYVISGTFGEQAIANNYKFFMGNKEITHTMFVGYFDKDWKYIWSRENDTTVGQLRFKPVINNAGRIHVTGKSAGNNESFNGYKFINFIGPHTRPVIIVLDTLGNNFWCKSASTRAATSGNAIALNNNKLYVTGSYSHVVWDGFELSNPANAGYDVFLASFSPQTGATLSLDSLKSTFGSNDAPTGMVADTKGNLYIAGTTENNLSVGPSQLYSNGGKDFFIAKFGTANCSNVVPLKLIRFTASLTARNEAVQLDWQTANEENVHHFTIQRSYNSTNNFENIAQVAANNRLNNEYSFIDRSPLTTHPSVFYRLQMTDKDGSFTFSNIEEVTTKENSRIKVYPNPATDKLFVQGNAITSISISDYTGRMLLSQNFSSTNLATINLSKLPKGIYLVKVADKNNTVVEKVVVE